jgi:hypothetical protein
VSSLDEQLRRWRAAGLLDDATAAAIRGHEARLARAGDRQDRSRVSLQEVIAYAGVALALAGGALFVSLHRDDLGLPGRLAVYVLATAAALVAAVTLRRGGAAGSRAAAGCVMVSILGVGLAIGDAATAGGWFTVLHHHPGYGPYAPAYDEVDHNGNAALALAAVALLALAATWWTRSGLLALVLAGATFGATFTELASRHADGTAVALVACIPGAALGAASFTHRLRGDLAGEVLRFWGTLLPAIIPLFADGPLVAPLTGLAGAISAAALVASPALNSNALAVAGGLGLFGLVVDVGVRWFSGPLGLPLVLIGAGVALIGVAALIQRIVSGNRTRAAGNDAAAQPTD